MANGAKTVDDVADINLRKQLSHDARWLIGILVTVSLVFGGFQIRNAYSSGQQTTAITGLQKSLDELSVALRTVIQDDLRDVRERIIVLESKNILPEAEKRISKLEEQISDLNRGPQRGTQ